MTYQFPFGQPLLSVKQSDKTPKEAFVLGVYPSAVHARWVGPSGKQIVSAFAVSNEPVPFWTGRNVKEIINQISIPKALGRLEVPKNPMLNGPSGKVLDTLILGPLGFNRANSWLCDLLPESRVNLSQREAIRRKYDPIAERYGLPKASIPSYNHKELVLNDRISEILKELKDSKADTIILLGDLPIRYFLRKVSTLPHKKLSDFCDYGKPITTLIAGKEYKIIALCHPRQAGKLGLSSTKWFEKHALWVDKLRSGNRN
jgi:hypothetical protein